jgi:hypothetical protein
VSKDHAIDERGDRHHGVSADDVVNICKLPIGGVSNENVKKYESWDKAGRSRRVLSIVNGK